MIYPLLTAPVGSYPMRCIYTSAPINPGQLVGVSPLGLVTLMVLTNTTNAEPLSADAQAYGMALLTTYVQRRGWLQPGREQLQTMTGFIFERLQATIPLGESRYIHQLLLQVDIVPWLNALRQP